MVEGGSVRVVLLFVLPVKLLYNSQNVIVTVMYSEIFTNNLIKGNSEIKWRICFEWKFFNFLRQYIIGEF